MMCAWPFKAALAGALCTLAACNSVAGNAKPASAPGHGNFVMCLADGLAQEVGEITIPARQIFAGNFRFQGDVRTRFSGTSGIQTVGPKDNEAASYAVMTTEPAKLSPSVPCRRVQARAIVYDAYSWTQHRISAGLKFRFQAQLWDVSPDLTLSVSPTIATLKPTPLDYLRKEGGLNGMPVAEVGDPVVIR